MDDLVAQIHAIRERTAKRELWLLEMTATDAWPTGDPRGNTEWATQVLGHLRWLEDLQSKGVLFLSGPIDGPIDRPGWNGSGISVLNVANREEAEALAATEPFSLAGFRTNTVKSWIVNEGSITVTVNLLGGTGVIR